MYREKPQAAVSDYSAAAVIDWIEAALNDEDNFRDIPEILAEAREKFVA